MISLGKLWRSLSNTQPSVNPLRWGGRVRELGYLCTSSHQPLVKGCSWGLLIPMYLWSVPVAEQTPAARETPQAKKNRCLAVGSWVVAPPSIKGKWMWQGMGSICYSSNDKNAVNNFPT